ncbi:MAG TPA: efflux RND transporter periplasmic adaptor subunit [Bryobacteraceae bacterium]|nr:efflux RND transporter periplasmic adaptor subunit [Bryobacteraceae bacterium]
MKRRRVGGSLCALAALVALGLAGCTSKGSQPTGRRSDAGVPVTIATVSRKDVPVEIQVIGNVEAYSTISVKAQVGGELTQVHFREGDYVKAGDLLFTIDRRPLQAALNEAEANVARDEAVLGQAEANLVRDTAQQKYAQSQAERYGRLFQAGVVSKDQAEQMQSNADALAAAVNADKAAVGSARASAVSTKAMVDNARVQFGYTEIRSPIDGRTGNIMVKQGNVVTANTVDLTTINQVEPIYVTFSVPEAQLPDIKRYMAEGKLPVFATPQADASAEERGVLTFVDNTVDATTGMIKLKGTFVNTDRKLWPGVFVRVRLRLTTQPNAIVVPNQAVQTGQEGPFVFVVKADRTVESRPIVTGARVDQDIVIANGLRAGETVVTEGQLRLAPGIKVQFREGRAGPAGSKKRG